MKRTSKAAKMKGTLRREYDFSGGVRGKYAERFLAGTNLVLLDPDVAEVFPTAEAVNDALRALARIVRSTAERRRRPKKRNTKPKS